MRVVAAMAIVYARFMAALMIATPVLIVTIAILRFYEVSLNSIGGNRPLVPAQNGGCDGRRKRRPDAIDGIERY